MPSTPQVDSLSRIMLLQSMLSQLPTSEAVFSFLCRGLEDLPGIAAVWHEAPQVEAAGKNLTLDVSLQRCPVTRRGVRYDDIVLRVTDREAFGPYLDYVKNLCFLTAVILEERRQHAINESHQKELESRISERTRQLSDEIRERLAVEETLRQSEEKFRLIATQSPDHILIQDTDLRYVWVLNPQLGLTESDMIGKTDFEILSEQEAMKLTTAKRRVLESGNAEPFSTELVARDGSLQYFEGSYIPRRDAAGRVNGLIGYFRNVTENKRAEQALKEADVRKDEFLAILGHELRNPLSSMAVALELWKRGPSTEFLARIKETFDRQVKHLTRLVNDLLEISRITRGKIALKMEEVLLSEMVERSIAAARELLEAQRHQLTVKLPEYPIYLRADGLRLEQIVTNLLTNAAKYTDDGGQIALTVEETEDAVLLKVRDNGLGIPAGWQSRIFELFGQVDLYRNRAKGGLGIGLHLALVLARMHGGALTVYSGGAGQGSEFTVSLPATLKVRYAQTAAESLPPIDRKLSILVVEDSADMANMLACLLRSDGHNIEVAYSGPAAVQCAAKQRPEVVICDIGLPGFDGYEVVRRLRNEVKLKSALIVALTGFGQSKDVQRAKEAGFDDHLSKPLDMQALNRCIAIWLRDNQISVPPTQGFSEPAL